MYVCLRVCVCSEAEGDIVCVCVCVYSSGAQEETIKSRFVLVIKAVWMYCNVYCSSVMSTAVAYREGVFPRKEAESDRK